MGVAWRGWRCQVLVLLVAALSGAAPPAPDAQQRRIAALIECLGDDEFRTRQQAQKDLIRIGKPAVQQLVHAARSSDDLELRKRAREILRGIDLAAWHRATRDVRARLLARQISEAQGVDATNWGEPIVNPFTALSEEGKKKLRGEFVDVERLAKMRARLFVGQYGGTLARTFVNRDPEMMLVFGKGFVTHGAVHSVGPVLALEGATFMNSVRGADLIWMAEKVFVHEDTIAAPLILDPTAYADRLRAGSTDVLRGDFGWCRPKDLCKPLLEPAKNDLPAIAELAAARKKLAAEIKNARGTDVSTTDHAKAVPNPFTNLTDEGKKKLKARGIDGERLTRLKKAVYLTGDHRRNRTTFVNADPDTVLILGKGFVSREPVYSLGPVVMTDGSQLEMTALTGADVVWLVEKCFPRCVTTGAPVILEQTVGFGHMTEGSKHVWFGDYGWRRPKGWPDAAEEEK